MEESFHKTNFGTKKLGDTFNLECCVRASDTLDGHMVSGHIDTTGCVIATQDAKDGSRKIVIAYESSYDPYVIPKGSITINGVSLTVVDVEAGRCSIRLIPQTLEKTNLSRLTADDQVNIEFDLIGKYIVNYMKQINA